ncbi:MAG TPA: tyrosine-type recombinase/integrase [Phycisphaerae bacterium]|nr:tyrosine-type recombinase/integrase [Phycisphaerae bacterium]HRY70092.1 tyrosine-type recombinase/integrase [Phycisphaerae bacterium]HSA27368.1 tyrosine-type recombinase/integrase [Phycisphaerae bacterium]
MARLFKTARTNDWCGKIRLESYCHRNVRLCSDKAVSETWLRLLQNAVVRQRANEAPDPEKLAGIPRRCLEALGLVSKVAESRRKSWADLVGEYADEMAGNRRSAKYVKNVRAGLLAVGSACGWRTMASINRPGWAQYVADRQKVTVDEDGEESPRASARTLNNELATLKGFMAWGLARRLIDADPLAGVAKVEESGDRRRVRRALTDAELGRLLANADDMETCYRTSLGAGLRLREVRELQWRDVRIDGEDKARPHLQLRPEATKAKRADMLPIVHDLAERLRVARPLNAEPTARVFKRRPTLDIWMTHLKRAGIDYTDSEGRIAGFHSLRVTYITHLQRAGLAPRVVMALARHTDWRLTGGTYTDMGLLDIFGAVRSLPTFEILSQQAAADGTYGTSRSCDQICDQTRCKTGPLSSAPDHCDTTASEIDEVQNAPDSIGFPAISKGKTTRS